MDPVSGDWALVRKLKNEMSKLRENFKSEMYVSYKRLNAFHKR